MTISVNYHQAGTHSARMDRRLLEALSTEGLVDGLAVTQRAAGANLSVDVAAGLAVITGDGQARDGRYLVELSATENVAIGAAPGSDSRIDLVVLTVRNSEISGGDDDAIVQVIAGTVAASPVAPALPASSIPLAEVTVAAGAATITDANITDVRPARTSAYAGAKLTAVDGDGTAQNINSTSFVELSNVTIDTAASDTDDVWVIEADLRLLNNSGGVRTFSLAAVIDGTAQTIKPTIAVNNGDNFDAHVTIRLRDKGTGILEGCATFTGATGISGVGYGGSGYRSVLPAAATFDVAVAAKADAATATTTGTIFDTTLLRLVAP